MPKKFTGENSKVAAARARKEDVKQNEQKKKKEKEEEEFWKDDDKNVQKKLQRKDEKEKKRIEQQVKKNELKTLADQEMEAIKPPPKQASTKISRLQIQAELEKREAAAKGIKGTPSKVMPVEANEAPIPENINRVVIEGEIASTIDEAIKVLRVDESSADAERHPEKRMKAAYTAFEEKNLPRLREENPNMRLSQVKQMLHKEWLKSPENPLNSSHLQYNKK